MRFKVWPVKWGIVSTSRRDKHRDKKQDRMYSYNTLASCSSLLIDFLSTDWWRNRTRGDKTIIVIINKYIIELPYPITTHTVLAEDACPNQTNAQTAALCYDVCVCMGGGIWLITSTVRYYCCLCDMWTLAPYHVRACPVNDNRSMLHSSFGSLWDLSLWPL